MQISTKPMRILGLFLVTLFVSFSGLSAQDMRNDEIIRKLFEESQTLYEQGKYGESSSKLKEIIGLNPSDGLINKLFRSTNASYWTKILQNDLTKDPAKRLEVYYWRWEKQRRRNPEYIEAIVTQMKSNDPDTRDRAIVQLKNIGHFSVPYLVSHLKDPLTENGMRTTATMALSRMVIGQNGEGVLPVIELLDSEDPLLLENAAIILGSSKDQRALAALKKVYEDPRHNQSVKNFVQYALVEISGMPIEKIPSAKELYYNKALEYLLDGETVIRESDVAEGVIYKYRAGDKLELLNIMEEKDPKYGVPEVARYAWHLYMAEEAIYDALALDISFKEAIPLLICIYHAQYNQVESKLKDIERLIDRQIITEKEKADLLIDKERLVSVRVLSQLSGKEYVYNALALALKHNLNEVAVTIIEQIKYITDGSEITSVSKKKKDEPVSATPVDGKEAPKDGESKGSPAPATEPAAENAAVATKEETTVAQPNGEGEPMKEAEGEKPANTDEAEKPAEAAPVVVVENTTPVANEEKPVEAEKPAEKVLTKEEKAKAKKEADAAKKAEKDKQDQEKKIADAKKKEEEARIKEEEKNMTPEQKKAAREQRAKEKQLAEIASKNNNETKPEEVAADSNVKEGELYGVAAPLINALMYKDQRVRYEAAMTVAYFNPKKTFPYADKVVELLASALGEKDQVAVLVIDSDNQRNLKVTQLLRACGFLVVSAENGIDGILYSRSFPSKDLVLIAGDLKGKNAERVYAELQADYRTKKTPVSIISDQVSKVRMTEKYAHITSDIFTPEDGKDAYLLMVRKIMESAEAPASAKLEKEAVAIKAAQALATIKREGTVFNLESSFDASIKVLSPPERVDEIRLPVIYAMAQFKAKPVLPAIIDTYLKDANAKPVRLASLYAIGEIDPVDPKGIEALILAVQNANDIDYRREASGSLGKGNHKAEKVTELLQDLRIKKELK